MRKNIHLLIIAVLSFTIIQTITLFNSSNANAQTPILDISRLKSIISMLEYSYKYLTNEELHLEAEIKGILGEYGLGALSPVMDQLLSGSSLKDVLKDSLGNYIGQSALLEDALSGVWDENDTVSAIVKQVGLDLPPDLLARFKNLGILRNEALLQKTIGGTGSCGIADDELVSRVSVIVTRYGWEIDKGTLNSLIDQCLLDPLQALRYEIFDKEPEAVFDPAPSFPNCQRVVNGKCLRTPSSLSQGDNNSLDLSTEPAQLVIKLINIILGIAGAVALFIIISAGYKIMTASGNPERIKSAKEQIISALTGLLFILLSHLIFQLIVVDILKIPGICSKANDPRCEAPAYKNIERKLKANT